MKEPPNVIEDATLRESFRRDGFVILRDVVASSQIESLRGAVDVIVGHQRDCDPTWNTTATARVNMTLHVDSTTVEALQFALGDTTFDVSRRALDCPADTVALSQLSVLCNPEFEPDETPSSGQSWGTDPRNWHRDVRPDHDAPLSALLVDEKANGPGYTQWNIALYDDAILYVIPGSHRRLTSDVEAMQLQTEGGTQTPLDGCVCVNLQAGDGVVYNSMLLHWGSKYTNRQKRRTLHFGYRSFGRYLPHQRECNLPERIRELLPAETPERRLLERSFELFRNEYALLEEIFRAAVNDDVETFRACVKKLHPKPDGLLTCLILLSRIARNVYNLNQERLDEVRTKSGTPAEGIVLQEALSSNFTAAELQQLWTRFGALDAMLRSGEAAHVSGFLGPPTEYVFEELPSELTEASVIAAMFSPV